MTTRIEPRKPPTAPPTPPVATKDSNAPPQDKTQVTAWLKENHAAEFAGNFYKQGYYDIADVDDEAVKKCVPEDKAGVRRRLTRSVKERNEKFIPEIPSLPAGEKFDLSAPSFTTKGDVTFKLPGALTVPGDGAAVISPGSLTPEQWMVIARNSSMLFGRVMDGDEPVVAQYPVLVWKVPDNNEYFRSEHLSAEVKSEITYSERSSNYVTQGFTKVGASLSVPFCAASVDHERKEKAAAQSQTKQTFMIGMWHFPRAEVSLEACTAVSPRFVSAVQEALKLKDVDNLQCAAALSRVFSRYGHVVGWKVDLGGRLFFVHCRTQTGAVNESELHSQTRAAVGIKTVYGGGEAGFATGSGIKADSEALEIAETSAFTALGGDATLASNPGVWSASVKDPNLWAVIGMDEVKSTLDLLPEDVRQQVRDVWRQFGRVGSLHGRKFLLRPASAPDTLLARVSDQDPRDNFYHTYCKPEHHYWLQRDDFSSATWTFIGLQGNFYWLKIKDKFYLASDRAMMEPHQPIPTMRIRDSQEDLYATWEGILWRVFPVDQSEVDEQLRCPGAYCIRSVDGLYLARMLNGMAECELVNDCKAVEATTIQWYLEPVED